MSAGCHPGCMDHPELPTSHHPDCPVALLWDLRSLPEELGLNPHATEVCAQSADRLESLGADLARLRDDNASLRDQVAQLLREAQEREATLELVRKAARSGDVVELYHAAKAALDSDAAAREDGGDGH